MRVRARLFAGLAPLAAAAAGCGSDAPSPEEEIRAVLRDFGRATAARDERRLCDEVFARRLVVSVERAGLPCEQALRVGLADVRDPKLEIRSVRVRGDRAEASVRTSAAGQRPSTDVVRLVRERGGWRVASLVG